MKLSLMAFLFIIGLIILMFTILIWIKIWFLPDAVLLSVQDDDELIFVSGYDKEGGLQLTTTFQPIHMSIDNSISFIESKGCICIGSAGTYSITYWVQFETSSTTGGQSACYSGHLQLDSTFIDGSQSSCFLEKQHNIPTTAGCGHTVIQFMEQNSTLGVYVARTTGTTSAQTRQGESSLTIKKLF